MPVAAYTKPEEWVTEAFEGIDQFVPKSHILPVGGLHQSQDIATAPKLFTPLKIGNLTVANRIGVSPMCTYGAAHDGPKVGHATDFHKTHINSFAIRGPGLVIMEPLAVNPDGRLSPNDLGIWNDAQAHTLKEITDFVHAQGVKIGTQIGHGGRKSSAFPMPIHLSKSAGKEHRGWSDTIGTVAPSAISFEDGRYATPRALTVDEIKVLVQEFQAAAKRAYEIANYDFIEIHAAHGYLISNFLSGLSNTRTDQYGGSFENRIRFLIEVVDAIVEVKGDKELFVRISASDMADDTEGAWTVDQAKELGVILAQHGVTFLDVSDGGNYNHAARRKHIPAYQLHQTKIIKEYIEEKGLGDKIVVSTVGGVDNGTLANEIVESGDADFTFAGSPFLKNPGLVLTWADELKVRVNTAWSYTWPFYPSPYVV